MKSNFQTFIILSFVCLAFITCSDRKRANPLDPRNPDTGGRPTGIRIYSEFDRITISWNRMRVDKLQGYNIYRQKEGDDDFSLLDLTTADISSYKEYRVDYEQQYSYYLTALGTDFETLPSDTVSIVPGPTVIWATDVDDRRIYKISHDGIHQISVNSTLGFPWDIEPEQNTGDYWYADVFYGDIYYVTPEEQMRYSTNKGWREPVDIELDHRRRVLWGADENSSVFRVTPTSTDTTQDILNEVIISPNSVSVALNSGDCWVADIGSRLVYYFTDYGTGIHVAQPYFVKPYTVCYNNSDNTVWVADSSRVIQLSFEGEVIGTLNYDFKFAYHLDVNENTNELWVIDLGVAESSPVIIKFDEHGTKKFELTGFTMPRNIVVNLYDNGCIVADSGSGEIYKIDSTGEIVGVSDGYFFPRGLAVEYKSID